MLKHLALLAALVALAGCAGQAARPADSAAIDALYATLAQSEQAYLDGVAAWRGGDNDTAQRLLRRASGELLQAANACAATPGCDATRFFAVYDTLVSQRATVLSGLSEGFASGEADAAVPGEDGDSPLTADVPEAAHSLNLLQGRALADIIRLNGPVKAALTEWLTWMRPNLIDAHENYQVMRHRMWPEYERAGLPEALLFGILAKESGGRVHAVSRAGASGPLQFMPATGQRFGLGRNAEGFDTRFDPQLATRANVAYLNERFAEFNHNLELALAAYNGGEGRVSRLYRASRRKAFWDGDIFGQLPPETRDYVPMVLAAAWLFLHPEDYGLEFPAVDATPASVVLPRVSSINELAMCIGNAGSRAGWFRHLRNLNPRYEAHAAIPAGTTLAMPAVLVPVYNQRCLEGPAAEQAIALAKARQPGGPGGGLRPAVATVGVARYTVRSGDSLHGIARRMQCRSAQQLAAANGIRGPKYLIKPGQTLSLAGCRGR